MKKEIIKPFDLEAYKKGAKIKTRTGHEVRIICTDAKNPYFPIIALVKANEGEEIVMSCTSEGKSQYGHKINGDDLVIVEEVEEPEFWSDKENKKAKGYLIDYISNIITHGVLCYNKNHYSLFAAKKQAKSALAMARISQIMANDIDNFGGIVTDEEWDNDEYKYVINRHGYVIGKSCAVSTYYFLAFHTAAQRDLFLEKYRDLVKEYFMID